MMNRFKMPGACAALLALSGCASILSDSVYPVAISSVPHGVRYDVTEVDTGRLVSSGVTPQTVMLEASDGFFSRADYAITFSQEGYHSATYPLRAGMDGWYFGNLFLGGLLGILIVDPATGAMWRLDNTVAMILSEDPSYVPPVPLQPEMELPQQEAEGADVPTEREAGAGDTVVAPDALTLMHLEQVPPAWRAYLVPVT